MKILLNAAAVAAILLGTGGALAAPAAGPATVDGRWDAVLSRNGVDVPFRLDIKGEGPTLQGVFYDGFRPYDGTTSASFRDGKLVLTAQHYLTTINADLVDGQLTGSATPQNRDSSAQYTFHAVRHVDAPAGASRAPSIAGSWVIPLAAPSSKGEKAFRFVVQQRGDEVAAAILRIDGDTGAYSGAFKDGKWVLSHFDGGRPGAIEVTPKPDGTLDVQQLNLRAAAVAKASTGDDYAAGATPDGRYVPGLTAYRAQVAKAKGLPEPEDVLAHTTARDPNETFAFNFPDAEGRLVSNDDPRFKGKVVLAIVTGTWCPNCHDEAQYLVQLDKKYRDKGLAIVALDFEEPGQQGALERERAFVKKYGVQYTYLIAGAPAQMWEKVPQLQHLDTGPATVFVGRDGRVKAVHSGFASPASGEFNAQLQQEFTTRIEQLLAERPQVADQAEIARPPLQVLKVNGQALVRGRTHHHDPRAAHGQFRTQAVRQMEVTEVAGGEPDLQPVRQMALRRLRDPRIADQEVDRTAHTCSEGADGPQVRKVEREHAEQARVALRGDTARRGVRGHSIPHAQHQVSSGVGQGARDLESDPGTRAGDHRGPARKVRRLRDLKRRCRPAEPTHGATRCIDMTASARASVAQPMVVKLSWVERSTMP